MLLQARTFLMMVIPLMIAASIGTELLWQLKDTDRYVSLAIMYVFVPINWTMVTQNLFQAVRGQLPTEGIETQILGNWMAAFVGVHLLLGDTFVGRSAAAMGCALSVALIAWYIVPRSDSSRS